MKILNKTQNTIDFSHKINFFQIGNHISSLVKLERKYPDMIKTNPLTGFYYESKNPEDGHSLFMYELNVIESRVGFGREYSYNYNKNTINSMDTNPQVIFNIKFNTIAVEYIEGEEGFFEFLTYILGMTGGIVSIVRIMYNWVYLWVLGSKQDNHDPFQATELS